MPEISGTLDFERNARKEENRKLKKIDLPNTTLSKSKVVQSDILIFSRLSTIPKEIWQLPTCKFCGTKRYPSEPPGFCCGSDKINLELPNMPLELWHLLTTDMSPRKVEFRRTYMSYNNTLLFSSIQIKYDTKMVSSR